MNLQIEESSFRDRDGFVFFENGLVFRAIEQSYLDTWNKLSATGFLKELSSSGKVVAFTETNTATAFKDKKVLEVEKIPFISYASEWTFSQLKKAALLTLDLQLSALNNGFTLKDASSFNVQFKGNKAVFIDLLSFEVYDDGAPWVAYRQFCTHFLCPLLLYKYNVNGVRQLISASIDGIPLDVCSGLLPFRSRFNLLASTHVHLHAGMQKKHARSESGALSDLRISKSRLVTMLTHMRDGIRSIASNEKASGWSSYYDDFSYSPEGFQIKKQFVSEILRDSRARMCLDLGCNTGEFSALASALCDYVIACDNDSQVVTMLQRQKASNLLALCIDLADPTPSRGWNNTERTSFLSRSAEADIVLALALVHHLSIAANVPFTHLARFFSRFRNRIIIEFVPKEDPQVKKLLVSRKDIFYDYTEENFLLAFTRYFHVEKKQAIPGCERQLYLMKRNES
jgi:ribosomal protein L11 methylase PrmA